MADVRCLTCGVSVTGGTGRCPLCHSLALPAESARLGLPQGDPSWVRPGRPRPVLITGQVWLAVAGLTVVVGSRVADLVGAGALVFASYAVGAATIAALIVWDRLRSKSAPSPSRR